MEPPGEDDNSKLKYIDMKYIKILRWNYQEKMIKVNLNSRQIDLDNI